jgi:transcriptional regulator with XRE-family HTH domain
MISSQVILSYGCAMQPEQMRAARAALNWSLDRLAEASGVHRNTISNLETRKYTGEPDTIAAVKRALEVAGVTVSEEAGETIGVSLRRFQVGDLVRFRPQTRVRFDYNIAVDAVGTVVGVEPHPPATGPTYKIQVRFGPVLVPYVFRFEYELVEAVRDTNEHALPEREDGTQISNSRAIIDEFCAICDHVHMEYDLYVSLVEADRRNKDLCMSIAPMFFCDLCKILCDHMSIQFCRITDPAKTGEHANLTSNYIVEELPWPDAVRQQLRDVNDRLMVFRKFIEPARSKRIVHVDFSAQTNQVGPLGTFPETADKQFLQDLQEFIDIAYGQHNDGAPRPISVAMATDTHQLLRALGKSAIFDQCARCNAGEKAAAVLDYEACS